MYVSLFLLHPPPPPPPYEYAPCVTCKPGDCAEDMATTVALQRFTDVNTPPKKKKSILYIYSVYNTKNTKNTKCFLQAMEKRGLLGAVAMAAVQNLNTIPTADASGGSTAGVTSAETASSGRGSRSGARHNQLQGRGGAAAGGAAAPAAAAAATAAAATPRAYAAVAEMLNGATDCSDMDEIFKSLSAVLADAQEESRQVR